MISLIDFGFKPCQKISALHGLYNQSARGIKQSTWNIFCSAFTFNSLGIHININKLVSFTDTPIRFYHVLRLDNVFKWGKYISSFFYDNQSLSFATLHFIVFVASFLGVYWWVSVCSTFCLPLFCMFARHSNSHTHIYLAARAFGLVFGLLCLGIIAVFISNIFNSFFNWLVHVEVVAFIYCKNKSECKQCVTQL